MSLLSYVILSATSQQGPPPVLELVGPDSRRAQYEQLITDDKDRSTSSDGRFVLLRSKEVRCVIDLEAFNLRKRSEIAQRLNALKGLPTGDFVAVETLASQTRSPLIDFIKGSSFSNLAESIGREPKSMVRVTPEIRTDLRLPNGRTLSLNFRPGDPILGRSSAKSAEPKILINIKDLAVRPRDSKAQLGHLTTAISLVTKYAGELTEQADRALETEAHQRMANTPVIDGWDGQGPMAFDRLASSLKRSILDQASGQWAEYGFSSPEEAIKAINGSELRPVSSGLLVSIQMPGSDGVSNIFTFRPRG